VLVKFSVVFLAAMLYNGEIKWIITAKYYNTCTWTTLCTVNMEHLKDGGSAYLHKEDRISVYYDTFPQWMVFANFVNSCNTYLGLVNNVDYIRYFVYTPVPSVNYCVGLGRCSHLVCIYACNALICFLLMVPYFRWIKIYIKRSFSSFDNQLNYAICLSTLAELSGMLIASSRQDVQTFVPWTVAPWTI